MKAKLTSRKFWTGVAGLATGIGLVVSGNTMEGTVTIISSILGYLLAEGIVDAAAVYTVAETVDEVVDELKESEEK